MDAVVSETGFAGEPSESCTTSARSTAEDSVITHAVPWTTRLRLPGTRWSTDTQQHFAATQRRTSLS